MLSSWHTLLLSRNTVELSLTAYQMLQLDLNVAKGLCPAVGIAVHEDLFLEDPTRCNPSCNRLH